MGSKGVILAEGAEEDEGFEGAEEDEGTRGLRRMRGRGV